MPAQPNVNWSRTLLDRFSASRLNSSEQSENLAADWVGAELGPVEPDVGAVVLPAEPDAGADPTAPRPAVTAVQPASTLTVAASTAIRARIRFRRSLVRMSAHSTYR